MELIENGIITLVCRPCHDIIHTAKDINNPNRSLLENKAACEFCGKLERGIFDRKKTCDIDKLLCRKCFLKEKNRDENQLSLFL
jgi:late competence protein required for DNA uptake (superfamily II DNA/RNA helicase)